MVIVTGHLRLDPSARAEYLDGCRQVVELAREAAGCLDYVLSSDLLDPGRINILERWESQEAVRAFRGDGVSDEQGAVILEADVAEYDVSSVRPLT